LENKYIEGWKAQTEYAGEYIAPDGRKWALNLYAVDDADALARMECVRNSFTILGRIEAVIPVALG
jgi:hypothetical protein